MKILKTIAYILVSMGFVCMLFLISMLFTSLIYYNHIVGNEKNEVESFYRNDISYFYIYGNDNEYNIDLKYNMNKEIDDILCDSFYLYDIYKNKVNINFLDLKILITINQNEELVLSKY